MFSSGILSQAVANKKAEQSGRRLASLIKFYIQESQKGEN